MGGGGQVIININVKNLEMQRPVEKSNFAYNMQFFIHLKLSHTKQGFPFTFPLNSIQGGPELTIQGGGKNACATYFGHISSMEARIFMKFET